MTAAGFREFRCIALRFARALFARGYQAVKIIARLDERQRRSERRHSRGEGGREEKTVPRIRMASYVSYKGKIVLAPFFVRGMREGGKGEGGGGEIEGIISSWLREG